MGVFLGGHANFLAVLGPSNVLFLDWLVHGILGQHTVDAGDVGLDPAGDDGDDLDVKWGQFWGLNSQIRMLKHFEEWLPRRRVLEYAWRAAFEALYTDPKTYGITPAIDPICTMVPFASIINGAKA